MPLYRTALGVRSSLDSLGRFFVLATRGRHFTTDGRSVPCRPPLLNFTETRTCMVLTDTAANFDAHQTLSKFMKSKYETLSIKQSRS
jgi:hypothetical protein